MKRTAPIALGAALLLGVTACGSAGDGDEDTVEIGMSVSTLNNPFFVQLRDGAEAKADELGVELTVTDAQNDASQQFDQVQNFVSQNVDAIVINPVDSDAAATAVTAATNANIPVIAADRTVNGAELAQTVASDNVEGGRLAADELAELIGGEGQVAVLQGVPGTSASRDRGQGFTEGIAEHDGIEVVAEQPADFDRAKGLDVMTNILQSNPDITGVFAENDEMALGAIEALGDRAGTDVQVVGFDGTPDGFTAIEEGTLAATAAQQPALLGADAVESAVAAADGETIDASQDVPVQIVTADNVGDFKEE
nr:substrate-binding domain-containing protein [Glycomyces salinus]